MITEENYLEAEKELMEMSDEALRKLTLEAGEKQPALFAYAASYYECLQDDDNRELFSEMIYIIWIAYDRQYNLARQLTVDDLEKMEEADEQMINEIADDETALTEEALKRMTMHPQSALISCLYARIVDHFGMEAQPQKGEDGSLHEAGIIAGVAHSFVNLMEKTRQPLYLS